MKTTKQLKIFALGFSLFLLFQSCSSYRTTTANKRENNKVRIYKTKIILLDGSKHSGFLYRADEQGVVLSKEAKGEYKELTAFDVKKISKIQLRRKSQVLRGAGIGFFSGLIVGGLLANHSPDSYIPDALGILIISVPPTILGAILGSSEKNIFIFGHPELLKENLEFLQSLSIASQLAGRDDSLMGESFLEVNRGISQ